jgi:hypothetical protein
MPRSRAGGPGSAPWMPQVLWPYSEAWASEVLVTSQHEYSPFLQYLQVQQARRLTLSTTKMYYSSISCTACAERPTSCRNRAISKL